MPGTIHVSSSQELSDAMRSAKGGETILLEAGARYRLDISDEDFSSKVTIRSADPANQAVLDWAKIHDVSNLAIEDVRFDGTKAGRPDWMPDLFVTGGRNISVEGCTLTGEATAFNNGSVRVAADGVRVSDTVGFRFVDNELSHYNFGLKVTRSDQVEVEGNDLHHMQADGMQFADVDDVAVEDNRIHDFLGSLHSINHNDMIQFYTSGTNSPSQNVVVRGNVLDSGAGHWTQGILFGNEKDIPYSNVLIEGNTVHNNSYIGILVDDAHGLTIRSNTVMMNHATKQTEFHNDNIYIGVIGSSNNVTLSYNVGGDYRLSAPVKAYGNVAIDYDDPDAGTYVGKLFDMSGRVDRFHVDGIKLSRDAEAIRELLRDHPLGSPLTRPSAGEPGPAPEPGKPDEPGEPAPPSPVVVGTARNDKMIGSGDDDRFDARSGNDLLKGFGGDDRLAGGAGIDHLYGGIGRDTLDGGSNNDMLWGEAGDDRLDGGAGRDHYIGGEGRDVFVLRKGEIALDRVLDFRAGVDRIELAGFGDHASVVATGHGNFTVVDGTYEASFTLVGFFAKAGAWID